jgi:hypothetical protein
VASTLGDLRVLLDDFVAGAPFMPFWSAFMEHMDGFEPERELSSAGQQAYDDLYELVYMGAANPVSAADRADGIIPEDELRERIRLIRLEPADGRMI